MVSNLAVELINKLNWDNDEQETVDLILRISNIMYNDTSAVVLPLDDGVYDQLLQIYKGYNPNYLIGAEPIVFNEMHQNEFEDQKIMYHLIQDDVMDSKLYTRDIWKQSTPILSKDRPRLMYTLVQPPLTKRLINTQHKYPELVGTLDKCKIVLNNDAIENGVFDKPSVQVFERDFIHMCLDKGIITPTEKFIMIGELKYDGISVEAEVCGDTIVYAVSRGDTVENIATDLTPILKNYKFYNATGKVPTDIKFGIKFEAVITKRNLERLGELRGKSYKNGRNAIIGLFGSSDAYRFVDYITLIPLSTSLEFNDRFAELEFLNKFYNCGEYNRFCSFYGDYQEILFQVKQFTESAEIVRSILPYMIDGVVISFFDQQKIAALGRQNSVNKYQMAIKFNPRNVRTIFLGYTYSVGKSGDIIPMVHFKPAEFIGTIHTKQTVHSYQRFKELNLVKGQEIDVDYVNDVISYITKPDTDYNRRLEATQKPEEFITTCPYCGSQIEISESGKSAKCPNINCHERKIMRMVDMIDKLGFKDFSEETVRALDLTEFSRLVIVYDFREIVDKLGPVTADKFILYQHNLIDTPIPDYKIMAALCFESMAEEKWKIVLKSYTIYELFKMNPEALYNNLTQISGVGPKMVNSIVDGFNNYAVDVEFILNWITVIDTKGQEAKPKVALTGFRDPAFVNLLNQYGFDCSDKYTVTKDLAALITTDINSTSSKMAKAKKYGIPIYTKQSFIETNGIDI